MREVFHDKGTTELFVPDEQVRHARACSKRICQLQDKWIELCQMEVSQNF